MIGQIVGGLTGMASGIIGGKKRRREQANAQNEFNTNKASFENLDTSNVYTNMENTMEDLTVNQGAANFAAEQSNQGLANTMNTMSGAAGGSGIAAMAQALAGQQQGQTRQASLDIGRQEQANQAAERQQAGNLQLYEKKGELISRDAENEKASTLLGMSQQRLGAANQARQEATNAIVGGVGSLAGGVLGGMADGVIGTATSLGQKLSGAYSKNGKIT
jgi:hypothetical protein|tara:strand:+ start:65 stop:721 length:657 start_codon:yes stop_codon:yes gene_type:complete